MTRIDTTVCVHGLGYVGLPTAAMLANADYRVFGYDTDPALRSALKSKDLDIDEDDLGRFVERALNKRLEVVDEAVAADYHLVCVPTPFDREAGRTVLSYVESSGESIASILRDGDTVVLESTVPPGITANYLQPILEESGLSATKEFTLAYSPETVLPGNTLTELRNNDRIVGSVGASRCEEVVELYGSFVEGDIRTTDATTAEFVKLIQNAYRDTNIAFANEIARLAHEFEIDSRSAITLANQHPRVDILRPGPGVGGHCIPIDPLFLTEGTDVSTLIRTAREVNNGMVDFIEELLAAALDELQGSTVALLGVAYKGGVKDTRQSPALALRDTLEAAGVGEITLTDPYVDDPNIETLPLDIALDGADAAVIVTDHPEYGALSPERFSERMAQNVIIDSRAMLDADTWEQAKFEIYQI